MSKSLLIIGGTGFFGNSILKYFSRYKSLKNIKHIIIVSRKKLVKYAYLKKLKKNYKITKINCDILKLKKIPYADYVIYAANSRNSKHDYLAVKNYVNLAKIYHKNSKIIFTSSGAVYGVQRKNIIGFNEDYLKSNKKGFLQSNYKNSYARAKLESEALFQNLGQLGLKVSIARCFAFVGEFLPLNSDFVIGNIIQNILNKKKLLLKLTIIFIDLICLVMTLPSGY